MKKRKLFRLFILIMLFSTINIFSGGSDDDTSEDSSGTVVDDVQETEYDTIEDYTQYTDNELSDLAEVAEEVGDRDALDAINSELDQRRSSEVAEALAAALEAYNTAVENRNEAFFQTDIDIDYISELNEAVYEAYENLVSTIDDYNSFNDSMESHDYDWYEEKDNISFVTIGDPVDISTGLYVDNKVDLGIKRHYAGGTKYCGSFGSVWSCSLDTRIIRGTDSGAKATIALLQSSLASVQSNYNAIADCVAINSDCEPLLNEVAALLQEKQARIDSLQSRAQKSAKAEAFNQFVNYGSVASYTNCGLEYLIFVDENGNHIIFSTSDNKTWFPKDEYYKQFYSITQDGADGFKLNKTDGTCWIFSEYGLPLMFIEKNGATTKYNISNGKIISVEYFPQNPAIGVSPKETLSIFRDSSGKITSINSSLGKSFTYSYEQNKLSHVCDKEGDVYSYNYDADQISKCVYPDGTFISFEFTIPDSSGRRRTSATINQEGNRETFSYDFSTHTVVHSDYSGIKTTCNFDEKGRTKSIRYADSSFVEYEYDEVGNLIQNRTVFGTTRFIYDSCGRRIKSVYPDGSSKQLLYDEKSNVISFINQDGVKTDFQYDEKSNCTAKLQSNQFLESYAYNSNNLCVSKKIYRSSNDFIEEKYDYNSQGKCIKKTFSGYENGQFRFFTQNFNYDSFGNLKTFTDFAGRKTYFDYSSHSFSILTPEGLKTQILTDNAKNVTTQIQTDTVTGEVRRLDIVYNKTHLPVEIYQSGTLANGEHVFQKKTESFSYTPSGKVKTHTLFGVKTNVLQTFEYDAFDKIRKTFTVRTDLNGNPIPQTEIESEFSYSVSSEPEIIFYDINGGSFRFASDKNGNIIRKTYPSGIEYVSDFSSAGNLLRQQTKYGGFVDYDWQNGFLTSVKNENDANTFYEYNLDGSIKSFTGADNIKHDYTYNIFGKLLKDSSSTKIIEYEYDELCRCILERLYSADKELCLETSYLYSKDGRSVTKIEGGKYKTQVSFNGWLQATDFTGTCNKTYEYNVDGSVKSITDGEKNVWQFEYDACQRPCKMIKPDKTETSFTYNAKGQLLTQTDATGIVVIENKYDKNGRLVSEIKRPGCEKTYKYDEDWNLSEIYENSILVEKYEYSDFNKKVVFSDGKKKDFIYYLDYAGRITKETDRLGKNASYEYATSGTMQRKTLFSGKNIRYEYESDKLKQTILYDDGETHTLEYNPAGRLIKVLSPDSHLVYEYDTGGELVAVTDKIAGTSILYTYNDAKLCTRKVGAGRDIRYNYDSSARLISVKDNTTNLSVQLAYDSCNREVQRIYGNNLLLSSFYDAAGRIVLQKITSSQNTLLYAKGYVYDSAAHLSLELDSLGNVKRFTYNNRGQLVKVEYSETDGESIMQFSGSEYSALNSLFHKMWNNSTYYLSNMKNSKIICYTYDENGNIETKLDGSSKAFYYYDSENRLLQVQNALTASNTSTNFYLDWDFDGNLLSKTSSESFIQYEYNCQNRMSCVRSVDYVSGETQSEQYTYDAFSRRCSVTDEIGVCFRTVYDGFSLDSLVNVQALSSSTLLTNFSPITASSLSEDSTATNSTNSGTSKSVGQGYRYFDSSSFDNSAASTLTGKTTIKTDSQENITESTGENSYLPNMLLYANGKPSASFTSNGQTYFFSNKFNSIEAVIDNDENCFINDYYAFGELRFSDSTENNLYFCGKSFNNFNMLLDYGFRDYDASIGIFTTSDPVRDGNNWYSYSRANPIDYCDLWGLTFYDGVLLVDESNRIAEDFIDHIDSRFESLVSIINNPENINNLISAQNIVMEAAIYQGGAGGNFHLANSVQEGYTWCNQSTYDVLVATGFCLDSLLEGAWQYNVGAKTATENLLSDQKTYNPSLLEVNPTVAQILGNSGVSVLGVLEGSNHLSTVRPTDQAADSIKGPSMANVSDKNGIVYASTSYGSGWYEDRVSFYIDQNQTGTYDPSNLCKEYPTGY